MHAVHMVWVVWDNGQQQRTSAALWSSKAFNNPTLALGKERENKGKGMLVELEARARCAGDVLGVESYSKRGVDGAASTSPLRSGP